MKLSLLITILLTLPPWAWAQNSCGGEYRCGSEYYDEPTRSRPPIEQPRVDKEVMGSCNSKLPLSQSYQANVQGVTCGEGVQRNLVLPQEVSKEIRDEWDVLSRSGLADAQKTMQEMRKQEQKWSGQVKIPMTENWSYTEIVGDFDAGHCGTEDFQTTCYKNREESYIHTWTEDIYEDYCTAYGDHSSDNHSSSGGGYGSSGGSSSSDDDYSSPWSSGSGSDGGGGSGEGFGGGNSDYDSSWGDGGALESDYLPKNIKATDESLDINRRPSSHCVSWGRRFVRTDTHREKRWRQTTRLAYSCVKKRAKWCTWPVTRQASRSCKDHVVKYNLEYKNDLNWRPGYLHHSDPVRHYNDLLPNKWDLLPGESEQVFVYGNAGVSTVVAPKVAFKNGLNNHALPWNEYKFQSQPEQVRCQYGMEPEFKIDILTLGRNKQKAPNPVTVSGEPLKFEDKQSRPFAIEFVDIGRGTALKDAQLSRNLPRPIGETGKADPNALYQDNGTPLKGTSASGGYWQESRFKIQLFYTDENGRNVRVTPKPESYSYDQIDVFKDTITISLEGKEGMDRFYRSGGPFEWAFGWAYRLFNMELTPGREYFIRLRVVSRGLPFYDSGCVGGKAICQGEEGTDEAYSEALDIKFKANEDVDNRSFFRKLEDLQEYFGNWF